MTSPSLVHGSTLDHRYVIQQFLLQGSSAEFYLARHRFTEREVVLKVQSPEKAFDRTVRERFEREARALSHVRHSGLVELLDVGEREGALYLALEPMKGRTLRGLLSARGRLDPADVLSIGLSLSNVLGHCHRAGIIHRDLKPDSVFILLGDETRLKLFDFALARLEPETNGPAGSGSDELAALGPAEYMAPEALRMRPQNDHRVDVYALGVLLYELLSSSVPFEGTHGDIVVRLSTGSPSLRSVRPDLPASLLAVIDRCLALDPRERFSSMESVTEALAQVAVELNVAQSDLGTVAYEHDASKVTLRETPFSRRALTSSAVRLRVPDARRQPRVPYTSFANLTLGGIELSGRVEEISVDGAQFIADPGARLVSDTPISRGEPVQLTFALPLGGSVRQVSATVRWTRATRARHVFGVAFAGLAEEDREVIAEYIALAHTDPTPSMLPRR